MAKTPWDAVYDVSFKSVPISESLKSAIQRLRDMSQTNLVGHTTTAAFLAEMRKTLAFALWADVKFAIHRMGAPDIPTHAIPLDGGKPIPVGLKTIEKAMGASGYTDSQVDQSTMLLVVSRCVVERISAAQEAVLTMRGDWWIKLLLMDIKNWLGSAVVEPEDMEEQDNPP